ncbi:diadenylate cyclase CdaA [bacterium]|nr:diadenylate cyclase CdaA [bacterium]
MEKSLFNIILENASSMFNFSGFNIAVVLFEIITITFILFFFYKKFIKGTNSEYLVKGIFVLIVLWSLSEILIRINLQIFGWFLRVLVSVVTFGLIVIFQPELRKFLSYMGQGDFFRKIFLAKDEEKQGSKKELVLKELIETIKYLSKFKIGGLIVLQHDGFTNISDVGTNINADVSQELLLTIFHPNTPLHDGAVVIYNSKILSAGVLLPLTENPKLSWRHGTRHRAAIGVTEVSSSACIVVSEETGDVSIAENGELRKCEDLGQLKASLERILGIIDIKEDKK